VEDRAGVGQEAVPVEVVVKQHRDIAPRRLEGGVVTAEAPARQQRRLGRQARGIAGMGGLDHRAVVGEQAARARRGDAERHLHVLLGELEYLGGRGGASQGAEDTRRVEAAQVGSARWLAATMRCWTSAQGIGHNQLLTTGAALGLG
jgi:hypothetical protein